MDPLAKSTPLNQAKQVESVVASDQLSIDFDNLSDEASIRVMNAILHHPEEDLYNIHKKVLLEAKLFLHKSLEQFDYFPQIDLIPKKENKETYLRNPVNEEPYTRISLDIPFNWYQRKIPKKILTRLVSDLNKEFNLNRRYGLFLLEENSRSYSILFNPNEPTGKSYSYSKSSQLISRQLAAKTFDPLDRFDKDELFNLHMEDSLMEAVLDQFPASKEDPPFLVTRTNRTWGLQTSIKHFLPRQKLIDEIRQWNEKYNIEKRAGVFRYTSMGSYFHLWFEPTEANQGLKDLKKELLSPEAIAKLENKYDIVHDDRTEWTY